MGYLSHNCDASEVKRRRHAAKLRRSPPPLAAAFRAEVRNSDEQLGRTATCPRRPNQTIIRI